MAINRQERAAQRLAERQEHAQRRAEQEARNEEAEASGAGGVKITDERNRGGTVLAGKSLSGPPENKTAKTGDTDPDDDPFEGVSFASAAARTAAEEAGLSAADFKRQKPSNDRGFTADDVRTLSAE